MFGLKKWGRLVEAQNATLKSAGDEILALNTENAKYLSEIVRLRGVARTALALCGKSDEEIIAIIYAEKTA